MSVAEIRPRVSYRTIQVADAVPLLDAGGEVLGLCGGPLREGYVQHWGPSA
ncbi:hypothetical protein [Streptomyces arboris]|uniref:hypothetical protein n=1 Tax=Streptomyces arboris TaxID=2600619 RepID=UPI003BF52087